MCKYEENEDGMKNDQEGQEHNDVSLHVNKLVAYARQQRRLLSESGVNKQEGGTGEQAAC